MGKLNKPLDRRDIERAMRATKSNKQAARYLGVSFVTYKKYAQMYKDDIGISMYEKHKNESGKGIPKMTLRKNRPDIGVIDILEGRINPTFFSFKTIKEKIINEGVIPEACNRCGFHERRVLDLKVPLIMSYKDGNKKNIHQDNIEFLCYNCYFLTIGDIFKRSELEGLENYATRESKSVDLQLEPSHKEIIETTKEKINVPMEDDDVLNRPDDFGNDLLLLNRIRGHY